MEELDPGSEFIVKESTVVDLIIAFVFYCMFGSAVFYSSGDKIMDRVIMTSLVPAIAFTFRAFVKTVAIRVNNKGIWFGGQPVTDWGNFISAKVNQLEMRSGGWEDRNELAVEYFKGTEGDVYKKTIPLLSTQNRSGEEIIAAIEYFYELHKLLTNKKNQVP
ncbi:MAG: hypothetical protein ABI741_06175 [Ferruginibacter sp.]